MSRTSKRVTFPRTNRAGKPEQVTLSARLEWPGGPVRAFAIFAHCFTCTKQSKAAVAISRTLADDGFAVLRFDFTGLGESEGDFAATTFASHIEDIVAAADFLRREHAAPSLLIGHSFGGTAVLAAAAEIPEARAVATIAAPSSPAHLLHVLGEKEAEIRSEGQASVDIGGRPFPIGRDFLEDVESRDMTAAIAGLDRALLVMHAPLDAVVSVDEAAAIFTAAKHPKSFISLDTADHLITAPADADYAARVLAAWAMRFVGRPAAEDRQPEEGQVVVSESGISAFSQDIYVGDHHLTADEPPSMGGNDLGPSPYDYLLAALGACTAMTLRMYADHKKLPLQRVAVSLTHEKRHRDDCEDCEGKDVRIDHIRRSLALEGDLSDAQRARLVEIADKCPVHRTLNAPVAIETKLAD